MKLKKILLSGADGYIALHIAKMLKEYGYEVITATRSQGGDLTMDFSNPSAVAALQVDDVDAMVHTVSPNEELYKTDIYRAVTENSAGIHAALDFCVNNHIRDFIYFSSFHVFGNQTGRLVETTPAAPSNDYGLAHCIAEQTVQTYNRSGKVNTWIVRPSNLFGVPVDCSRFKRWNLIPFAFCKEAAEHNTITLLTSGDQLRNFVGISDVCRRLMWILEQRPVERLIHAFGRETMSIYQYALRVQKIAFEVLQQQVQIIRPAGETQAVDFEFASINGNPGLAPLAKIEDFVAEMLKVLKSP